jgi:methionine aminotransferase
MCASGKRSTAAAARELRKLGHHRALPRRRPEGWSTDLHFTSKLPDVGTTIFTIMSRRAIEEGALNIGQGFPRLSHRSAPERFAARGDRRGRNQYAPMEGVVELREQIAAKLQTCYGRRFDPAVRDHRDLRRDRIALRCHPDGRGSGVDEAIIFDPAYDVYEPAIRLAGAVACASR